MGPDFNLEHRSHEGKLIGIENHRKMTSNKKGKKDNLTGRRNHMNFTSLEVRRPYWKITLACLANQSCTELGPAQPLLVFQMIFLNVTS